MEIGNNIKKLRKERGLTQKALADKCGIAQITVRQYEAGKRQPKLESIYKISSALGVRIEDITGIKSFESGKKFDKRWKELSESCDKNSESVTIIYKAAPSTIGNTDEFTKLKSDSLKDSYKETMNNAFEKLNQKGQMEAVKRVEELTEIKKYTEPDQ